MTLIWIALAVAAVLAGALTTWLVLKRRPRGDRPELVKITDLEDATSLDPATGAVRSVQKADLSIDEATLSAIWTPVHLERLARTYWRFLTRVTLGLIRVRYTPGERSVVLLTPPLRLLTFQAPEYEMDAYERARALADRARPARLASGAWRQRLPADRRAPQRER